MKTITASEANRSFSKMLRVVAGGESYTIVSRGRAVAALHPAGMETSRRSLAKTALLERLVKQPVLEDRGWTREELYE